MRKLVFCALAIAVLSSCGAKKQQKETEVVETKTIATKVATVESAEISLDEIFTSEILPYKEVNIMPAASGVRIDKILVDVGDVVRAGQLVATLDPTQYNQQMTMVNNLQVDYDRLKSVYEAGGISKQALDQSKMNLDVQKEVADNLKKNINVLSPISGVITARNTEAGNLYTSQPIFTVMQISTLKVKAQISEMFFPNVKNGMPVDVTVGVYPDEVFEGKVSLISPAINAATRTFEVEVTLPNASNKLRPGMYARTNFTMGTKSGIMIPDVAVLKQMGTDERYVYVVENGVAKRRRVDVGRLVGAQYDILSGLNIGEKVVITAFSRIDDGTKVSL